MCYYSGVRVAVIHKRSAFALFTLAFMRVQRRCAVKSEINIGEYRNKSAGEACVDAISNTGSD